MPEPTQPIAPMTTEQLLRHKLKELTADRDKRQKALEPLRAKCNQVHIEIQALYDTISPLGDQIKASMPALQEIENEISKIALALGGKRMSDTATPAPA